PPGCTVAHHLAQIEPITVESKIDDTLLAAAIMQRAPEFRAAQLAARVLELEVAAADRRLGGEREGADRSLPRHIAVASGPTEQRPKLGAIERDRTLKHWPSLALREASRGFEIILARQLGGKAVYRDSAVLHRNGEIDAADEIAADACLVELD